MLHITNKLFSFNNVERMRFMLSERKVTEKIDSAEVKVLTIEYY